MADTLPFHCSPKTDNLLVAGRCICFERELVEDTRIIGTCLVTHIDYRLPISGSGGGISNSGVGIIGGRFLP